MADAIPSEFANQMPADANGRGRGSSGRGQGSSGRGRGNEVSGVRLGSNISGKSQVTNARGRGHPSYSMHVGDRATIAKEKRKVYYIYIVSTGIPIVDEYNCVVYIVMWSIHFAGQKRLWINNL